MVRILEVDKFISDEEIKLMKGQYATIDMIKYPIINTDTDVYFEGKLLMKFRKEVFNPLICQIAWDNYHKLAKASRGRGASAGEIDPKSEYWKKRTLAETKTYSTSYMIKGGEEQSKMRVNNQVASYPIGYYESTKGLGVDLPCRLTHYTRENLDKFHKGVPFIEMVDESYKNLTPEKHSAQHKRASLLPDFQISNTSFSTFTINRNFQTGIHTDSGDWGFGNLAILERGKYKGGYFVMPQFGVAVDLRQGDHLCCDVHQYHSNTKMYETQEDFEYNVSLEDIFKDNPKVGTLGLHNKFSRVSFVFYLRENIKIKCDSTKKFIINLKRDKKKMILHKGRERWEACDGKEVSLEEIDNSKLFVRHNTKENKKRGIYGCLQSHLTLLRHIIDNKINDVCIIEDDSTSDFVCPKELKDTDHITYLGGWVVDKKINRIAKPVPEKEFFFQGINKLGDCRCLTTRCYYIPKWELAKGLLDFLEKKKRYKAIDIMMAEHVNHIYYPALSKQILGYESTIGNKNATTEMEFY